MLVLVCGDRNGTMEYHKAVQERLCKLPAHTTIMHGAATGVDTLAGMVAEELGFAVQKFPADWNKHGRAAGPIRNLQMLDCKPDLVLAFHKDLTASKGTKHTVTEARRRKFVVEVIS